MWTRWEAGSQALTQVLFKERVPVSFAPTWQCFTFSFSKSQCQCYGQTHCNDPHLLRSSKLPLEHWPSILISYSVTGGKCSLFCWQWQAWFTIFVLFRHVGQMPHAESLWFVCGFSGGECMQIYMLPDVSQECQSSVVKDQLLVLSQGKRQVCL